eukprot:4772399-Amphidinium_carterae.2
MQTQTLNSGATCGIPQWGPTLAHGARLSKIGLLGDIFSREKEGLQNVAESANSPQDFLEYSTLCDVVCLCDVETALAHALADTVVGSVA